MKKDIDYLITELSNLSVRRSTVISELQVIDKECQELQNNLKEAKRDKGTKVKLVIRTPKATHCVKATLSLLSPKDDTTSVLPPSLASIPITIFLLNRKIEKDLLGEQVITSQKFVL